MTPPVLQRPHPVDDEQWIDADRLDLLLNQMQSVLLANVVNPLVLWAIAGSAPWQPWALWVLAQAILSGVRWQTRRELRRRVQEGETKNVARHCTLLSLVSGLFWGGGAAYLMAPHPASLLAFSFVVGGMVTAAAGTTAVHFPSFASFTLAALLPLALRLWTLPPELVGPMPLLVVLFGVLMTIVARRTHRSLGHSFRLRHENAELVLRLGRTQTELVQTNRDLERTVEQRTSELVLQRARLAQWIRDTPDGLLSLVDGSVVAFNPALQRMLGKRSEELLGQPLLRVPGFDEHGARGLLSQCEQLGHATSDITLQGDCDVRYLEVHASAAQDRPGQVELVLRDVSERRRAAARLRALEEDAQRAARLTAIRRLAGGVAHEYNNILAVMQGTLERLRGETASERQGLTDLHDATQRAVRVTRQLLSVSQRRHGHAEPVELDAFVREQHATLERLVGQELPVVLALAAARERILVDGAQLEEVLLHVIVHLSALRERALPGDRIELRSERHDGRIRLRIAFVFDEPLGDEVRARLDDDLALELAAARGLVAQQGGTLQASPLGPSQVSYELTWPPAPLVESSRPPSQGATAGEPKALSILVVDDEPVLRDIVATVLRTAGHTVHVAASAAEALAVFDAGLRIELLLTDVVMPGKDGPTLARELRRRDPSLRVCFMSGYSADFLRDHLATFENAVVLEKPFPMALLLERVAQSAVR